MTEQFGGNNYGTDGWVQEIRWRIDGRLLLGCALHGRRQSETWESLREYSRASEILLLTNSTRPPGRLPDILLEFETPTTYYMYHARPRFGITFCMYCAAHACNVRLTALPLWTFPNLAVHTCT